MKLPKTGNWYWKKDAKKAAVANKFIGIGGSGSSTAKYAAGLPSEVVNCMEYTDTDIVFVSINGARGNRVGIEAYIPYLKAAMEAGATIITDDGDNRNRPYNIGERELAKYLDENEYRENGLGVWRKI